ncbi:glycosyltransferase [Synechococcus sp. PCC 7502]|uniref:glycosyltransferase family 4 protein n=1 Tax=Synechococcus sp. PCC 7502 TaxID=1173263 RepID=UPI00029F8D5F|nr:glycosyltransferase family 4 protein [Synechococcus sp. PCC 7502]AFY73048.1 glycosyltransferase [Synechococcus sp. PCC 7502]
MLDKLRVALVHEWLVDYSGSERVIEQILRIFPQADVFAVVEFLPKELKGFIQDKSVQTTFIQKLPFTKTKYRFYLPLMPIAIEQLDVSSYDLVLSSSHAVAKGVLTSPNQLHISYVHSPIRYAWDLQHQYLREANLEKGLKSWLARWFLHQIRLWDVRTANGVDGFIANSKFIARRIYKVYRREAHVIYPPVNVEDFQIGVLPKEDFYLTAARFVPYKRVDLIVEAFAQMPDKNLIVIGDGAGLAKIQALASNCPNITLIGYQPPQVLRDYMQRSRAFVFAAEEDFGITVVEAQACGTPVIAFGRGGALETIQGLHTDQPTGVFFHEQSVASLKIAVREFSQNSDRITSENCRNNALRFSPERFRQEFKVYVQEQWELFTQTLS